MSLRSAIAVCLAVLAGAAHAQVVTQPSAARQMMYFGNAQTNLATGSTTYMCQVGGSNSIAQAVCVVPVPFNATFRNLWAVAGGAQGAGQTAVVTLQSTGAPGGTYVDSVLTCTMSNARACSDTTDSVTLAAGSMWILKIVLSVAAAASVYGVAVEVDPQ